jgi:beta-glucosidase
MKHFNLAAGIGFSVFMVACSTDSQHVVNNGENKEIWPKIRSEVKADPNIEQKVDALLAKMTLEQKIAQMIQPEIRDITVEDMRRYGFGSYLNGGGAFPNNNKHSTPQDWIDLAEAMYQASVDDSLDGISIPTMWGTDAVHGHNNVIGATLFPHNIGLGAANNPELIEEIARITATEVMVTGIDWVFAPTVATVRDDRWGRTYEGYSEDPEIVRSYAASIVKGLQGRADQDFLGDNRVISTVKHFIGDGGTIKGDDQGNNIATEQELFDIHAQGYVGGLTAGAQSVMASFNSWHGEKIHGSKYLLTDVLKEKMGFDGFVVGDWNGHGQIKGCSNENCSQAVNAGLDMYMVPTQAWLPLMNNLIAQTKSGEISIARVDDAVRRILRVKFRAGLFDKASPAKRKFSGKTELIGHENHRKVAQQAVRESLVLLKNKDNILPLAPTLNVLVAGDAAHNIGKQSGGWTITWQGTNNTNADFPGGSSILDGLSEQIKAAGGEVQFSLEGNYTSKPDVAIVVFGEEPYAEGHGDLESLDYQRGNKKDLALLEQLKSQGIPTVSVFISGRPMWVNAELNQSDAFVAAWLPGSEGKAIADVLLRNKEGVQQHDFTGKLSFSWPAAPYQLVNRFDEGDAPLFPYGYGLSYVDKDSLPDNLSTSFDMPESESKQIALFNGKVKAPWQQVLFSSEKGFVINSNSKAVETVRYRTIDRHIQEDSFNLRFKGDSKAGFAIVSKNGFREDLSSALATESALVLQLKRNSDISGKVFVSMNCESIGDEPGSCRADIDISEDLKKTSYDQWSEVSIDSQCFAKQGMKFRQATTAFAISSEGELNVDIHKVAFVPNSQQLATIRCSE